MRKRYVCSEDFSKLLIAAREASDKSERQLAAEMGISNSTLARWEKGEMNPGIGSIPLISKALNLDVITIMFALYPDLKKGNEKLCEAVCLLGKLSSKDFDEILEIIKAWAAYKKI